MAVSEHIVTVIRAGGDNVAIDFNGQNLSWDALGSALRELDSLLVQAGIDRQNVVGLLGRNRLAPLGAFIAVLGGDRELLLVNAQRPPKLIGEEVAGLQLPVLLGERGDLGEEIRTAARRAGTGVLAVDAADGFVRYEWLEAPGKGPFRKREPGTLIEIQTSGTTGAPKRIPISERTIESSLRDGVRNAKGAVDNVELTPKASPTLMFGPLVHTSGTFNTLMSVFEVRPIVLFEKFDPVRYREVLQTYRPKFAALPPTAIKMILDSEATAEDFASVKAVRAGTAALPVDVQIAFEERFGVPVLTTYGATEFMGVVTSWTLDDHHQYAEEKRGSVGRVSKGVQVRIIHPVSGSERPIGESGLVEAKLDRIDGGKSWIRTSDLGYLDSDGFLFIVGRVDDAINRGGFKIMAGKVADAVRRAPGVADAIVLGRPDERLGEVPVAVVEARPGEQLDEVSIREFCRSQLTSYEVPARVLIVTQLPRTVSDKISKPEVGKLLEAAGL